MSAMTWRLVGRLKPGSRQNASSDEPGGVLGQFQLNIDGQRLTQQLASGFQDPLVKWPAKCPFVQCRPYQDLASGSPIIQLRGLTIGQQHTNLVQQGWAPRSEGRRRISVPSPIDATNIQYYPRMLQLGFRAAF